MDPGRTIFRFSWILIVSLASLSIGGCKNSTTIFYEQLGACNGYSTANGTRNARPYTAFVIFRIDAIDNTQSSVSFHFDPSHLIIRTTKSSIDPDSSLVTDLFGASALGATTVSRREFLGVTNGLAAALVRTTASDGASEANKVGYLLNYMGNSSDPQITEGKNNVSQTAWPYTPDCRTIKF